MNNTHWTAATSSSSSTDKSQDKLAPWEAQSLPEVVLTKPTFQLLNLPLAENKTMKWVSNESLESLMTEIDCSPAENERSPTAVSFGGAVQSPYNRLHAPRTMTSVPPTPPQWIPYSPNTAPNVERHHSEPTRGPSFAPEVRKPRKPVVAMPGTMSSRPIGTESPTKQRKRGASRDRNVRSRGNGGNKTPALGTRFRSAFRDIFHKSPVDGNSFERIEDKHWSDEW